MKNREFWKGALAGVLITACVSTGVYTGVNYFRECIGIQPVQ